MLVNVRQSRRSSSGRTVELRFEMRSRVVSAVREPIDAGTAVRMLLSRYSVSSAVSRPIEAGSVAILFPSRFSSFKFVSAPIASGKNCDVVVSRSSFVTNVHVHSLARIGARLAYVKPLRSLRAPSRSTTVERGEADARRLYSVQRELLRHGFSAAAVEPPLLRHGFSAAARSRWICPLWHEVTGAIRVSVESWVHRIVSDTEVCNAVNGTCRP